MSDSKKIAVIIPTYNSVEFLDECLTSILDQVITFDNLEIEILVGIDNCDKTLGFFEHNKDKYVSVRLFYFNENVGPYVIKNTLAKSCDACYLVFFDSDDIMADGYLQGLVTAFLQVDMIRSGFKEFIDTSSGKNFNKNKVNRYHKNLLKNQKTIFGVENEKDVFNRIKNNKYLKVGKYKAKLLRLLTRSLSPVFAIKRDVFLELNGYRPWRVAADIEFIKRAHHQKIKDYVLPRKFDYLKRVHAKNLTSDKDVGMGSKIRNQYHRDTHTSVYTANTMVLSTNFYEI